MEVVVARCVRAYKRKPAMHQFRDADLELFPLLSSP